MSNPFEAPEHGPDAASQVGPPTVGKMFKVSGIGVATFVGTMLAGGLLLRHNFKQLGMEREATLAWVGGLVATLISFALAFVLPDGIPAAAYTIPQILIMTNVARSMQGAAITRHEADGGALHSNWRAFWIALGVVAVLMVVLIAVAIAFPGLFPDD